MPRSLKSQYLLTPQSAKISKLKSLIPIGNEYRLKNHRYPSLANQPQDTVFTIGFNKQKNLWYLDYALWIATEDRDHGIRSGESICPNYIMFDQFKGNRYIGHSKEFEEIAKTLQKQQVPLYHSKKISFLAEQLAKFGLYYSSPTKAYIALPLTPEPQKVNWGKFEPLLDKIPGFSEDTVRTTSPGFWELWKTDKKDGITFSVKKAAETWVAIHRENTTPLKNLNRKETKVLLDWREAIGKCPRCGKTFETRRLSIKLFFSKYEDTLMQYRCNTCNPDLIFNSRDELNEFYKKK